MAVTIIADSTSEIQPGEATQMDVQIVPLKTIFGGEVYLDGIEMTPEAFYAKLATSEVLPSTTQPSPDEFALAFQKAVSGKNAVVAITISSKLSGTYQSAQIAKESLGKGEIYVVDSETATISMRALVEYAARLRDEGKSAGEIYEILESCKKKIRLRAMVDTLEYFYRGGRISRTVAFAGGLLGLKPIIGVDDGLVVVYGKARGTQKAYQALLKMMQEDREIDFTKPVCLGYTGNRKDFEPFAGFISPYLSGVNPSISAIGSVIGTHAGPGASAMAYFLK